MSKLTIQEESLYKNAVLIDPDIISGWYASIEGLVIINADFKEYIIPMSYQAALENVQFLETQCECIIIDKRESIR